MVNERKQDVSIGRLQKAGGAFGDRVTRGIKATLKRFLPKFVIQEVQQYRTYEKAERHLYLKIRLSNSIGLVNPKRLQPPKSARSFLFVCFGNIIRSPMCEALMKQALESLPEAQVAVDSAGLNAVPGTPAHPWAVIAAQKFGISLEKHRAKLLTPEMVNQADVIFVMDYQNQVQLLSRHPRALEKVFMLCAYACGDYHSFEIADPYHCGADATRSCYEVLNVCIQNLVSSYLCESPGDPV